jgi:hypothetical protein
MSNSPVHNSPILRRLRANSGYVGKGPVVAAGVAGKDEAVTSPMATRLSEDEARWRPRSFDSFFQDVPMSETGSLLEDFDHLRPPFNQPHSTSSPSSSSSSTTASTASPFSLLSASAPHYTRQQPRGFTSEDPKLAPRQLFDGQQHQQHHQGNQLQLPPGVDGSASNSNSDSDSNESNLFNSYNAFNNAYASPLSFSASTIPVRGDGGGQTDRGHGGGQQQQSLGQQGGKADGVGAARFNRSSPPRTIKGEPIPLAKSFSDGEIEMNGKAAQERSSSQSPLRLLAARNNLETPATQRSTPSAAAAALARVDGDVDLADYDSEMGSSDYESEEEEVARGLAQFGLGRSASVSAPSGVMRKRVVWQRSRSLSGKTSGYPRSGSSSSSGASSSSSSSLRLGRPAWFYLLLLVEVAALFYVGYVFRSSYSAISLNEFEGFISGIACTLSRWWSADERGRKLTVRVSRVCVCVCDGVLAAEYPKAEEAHLRWRDNSISTCTYVAHDLDCNPPSLLALALALELITRTAATARSDYVEWLKQHEKGLESQVQARQQASQDYSATNLLRIPVRAILPPLRPRPRPRLRLRPPCRRHLLNLSSVAHSCAPHAHAPELAFARDPQAKGPLPRGWPVLSPHGPLGSAAHVGIDHDDDDDCDGDDDDGVKVV